MMRGHQIHDGPFPGPQHRWAGSGRAPSSDDPPPRPFRAGSVPNFKALHEAEKRKQEVRRRREGPGFTTSTQPFDFQYDKRRQHVTGMPRARNLPAGAPPGPPQAPPKDPAMDWRYERSARPPVWRYVPVLGGKPRPFSAPARKRGGAAETAPEPKSTEKVRQQQQVTAKKLQERREKEEQMRVQLEQAHVPSKELRERVYQACGPKETMQERVDRLVDEKRACNQRVMRDKQRLTQAMRERVERRPLLMEQADCITRARRRALFKVKAALEAAGVRDVSSHFLEEELDELDHEAARDLAAATAGA